MFSSKILFLQVTIRYIEINDERCNKGLRIRYKIFNELEFSETNIIGRNTTCARVNHTRIVTIPNIDDVSFDKIIRTKTFFL